MNQNKLSADPLSLVLGILAIVIGLAGCCCYGVTAVVPLIMAIIGLVSANKSLREFSENPDAFSVQSRSNVNTAKVINIIAIVFNGLIVLVAVVALAFYGTIISSAVLEGMRNGDFESDDYEEYEWKNDSINDWEEDDYIIEQEKESISVDSIEIQ